MPSYAENFNPNQTPQSEQADPRQVEDHAGGYVFTIDKWARLERFLILGADSPTYYQSAKELTRENGKSVVECWNDSASLTLAAIVDISVEGRAARNDAAIFALALGAVHPDEVVRGMAFSGMHKVCRTGTHLFQFVDMARKLGKGWGRGMKRAVADWYDLKDVGKVAYQVIKYRSREGYTHKRLFQTAHPEGDDRDPARRALYRWIVGKEYDESIPGLISGHVLAMLDGVDAKHLITLINEHKLPWEALPTWALKDPEIWQAMIPHLGLTAIIRNLGNMTRIGAIKPMSNTEQAIVARLGNDDDITKSRVHPFSVLQAMSVYQSGRGFRGSNTWDPTSAIVDALDGAFYKAFTNVESTGKRILLALDVSGSMGMALADSPLTVREGSAAMALITMAAEPNTYIVGFTAKSGGERGWSRDAELTPLNISPRQRLDDVVRTVEGLSFGGTDCALPMIHALAQRLEVDAFIIYTDNETWAGDIHPHQALRKYREKTGIAAKLVVVGMTSSGFSIADPNDAGMLDVVGFDSAAPQVISNFVGHK